MPWFFYVTKNYGRSDGMSFSRLGYKRQQCLPWMRALRSLSEGRHAVSSPSERTTWPMFHFFSANSHVSELESEFPSHFKRTAVLADNLTTPEGP